MASFKELAEQELAEVFLDPDVFAQPYCINGTVMNALVTDDVLTDEQERWQYGVKRSFGSGLYMSRKKIHVRKEDFGRKPKVGNPLKLDDQELYIAGFDEQQGLYVITVERRRQ